VRQGTLRLQLILAVSFKDSIKPVVERLEYAFPLSKWRLKKQKAHQGLNGCSVDFYLTLHLFLLLETQPVEYSARNSLSQAPLGLNSKLWATFNKKDMQQ
jgi:hypothetical protein